MELRRVDEVTDAPLKHLEEPALETGMQIRKGET
jgi:hypothetical protein